MRARGSNARRPASMSIALAFLCHLALCLRAQAQRTPAPPQYNEAFDNGTYGYYPTRTYATREDIDSPQTNFLHWSPECDDGRLYFVTPRGWALPKPGPMILDSRGDLVWSHHFENKFGGQAYDFMVQRYRGEDYLTFWLGDDRVRGHGSGSYYMLNSSYDVVHKVGAANGLSADLHEFLITPEGTALMTMYQVYPHDVTAFRSFDPNNPKDKDPNYIWDCAFQEIDIATGDLVFEWRASEHVDLNATYRDIGLGGTKHDPFDWFHINSLHKDGLGNFLISARYPHSILYIDGRSKETIWQLGGKENDFLDLSDGASLNFAWQHDARFVPLDTFPNLYTPPAPRPGFSTQLLTFFDNAAEDQHYEWGLPISRGLLLELTYPSSSTRRAFPSVDPKELDVFIKRDNVEEGEMDRNEKKVLEINGTNPDYTVRVIKSYENPNDIRSSSQGSMQILPSRNGQDPHVFVGYGLNAVWTEFDANGSVLCDAHFGAKTSFERGDIQSYRSYKFPWTGRPETRPEVEISDDDAEVYVSWLGATDVEEWILQCADTATDVEQEWADVVRLPKDGFETTLPVSSEIGDSRYLRVIAIAKNNRRMNYGTSDIIDRGILASYFPSLGPVSLDRVATQSPMKIFLWAVCIVSVIFIIYEMYRRYLSWRMGRPGAGPLRWRKGPAYRLLAEA